MKMIKIFCRRRKRKITLILLVYPFMVVMFLLILIPVIFKYSSAVQRTLIFANSELWPKSSILSEPSHYDLQGARNFYLTSEEGVTLGVWHIYREITFNESGINNKDNSNNKSTSQIIYDNNLTNGQNILLYNHGNSGSRASIHRVEHYKVLRKQFHVITYDYRGFADSSFELPTENGLVKDVVFMYNWISNITKSKIFVWGHSLGTGITLHALALLEQRNIRPYGVFLESPFNNMNEEVIEHVLGKIFKDLPWFHNTVIDPLENNNLVFKNDEHIAKVKSPILILHAKDDYVVPYKLGMKLYQTAITKRNFVHQGFVKFYSFKENLKYGHRYIYLSPVLDEIISRFVKDAIKENINKRLQLKDVLDN